VIRRYRRSALTGTIGPPTFTQQPANGLSLEYSPIVSDQIDVRLFEV